MKYYQINRKLIHKDFKDEDGSQGRRMPAVAITNLVDRKLWNDFKVKNISYNKIIEYRIVLDFLNCEELSGDYLGVDYDWILLDAFSLKYDSTYSPIGIYGWVISPKFKTLLEKQHAILGKQQIYVPAKLRFQGDYLDYFLCQYINYHIDLVDLDQCTVIDLPEGIDDSDPTDFRSHEELKRLIGWYEKAENFKVRLHFKENQDVFNIGLIKGTYASEKFKNIVEDNGITGFEFKPAPHLEITFPPNK